MVKVFGTQFAHICVNKIGIWKYGNCWRTTSHYIDNFILVNTRITDIINGFTFVLMLLARPFSELHNTTLFYYKSGRYLFRTTYFLRIATSQMNSRVFLWIDLNFYVVFWSSSETTKWFLFAIISLSSVLTKEKAVLPYLAI